MKGEICCFTDCIRKLTLAHVQTFGDQYSTIVVITKLYTVYSVLMILAFV